MVRHRRIYKLLLSTLIWGTLLLLAPFAPAGTRAAHRYGFMAQPPAIPVAAAALPLAQTDGISLEAHPGYAGTYRIGSWVPVHITVQNDSADITAEVRVHARSTPIFAAPVDLPQGARKTLTVYAFVPDFVRRMTVHLVRSGAAVSDQEALLAHAQITLEPENTNVHMVAVVTGAGTSVRLPERLNQDVRVVHVALEPADLPKQTPGLSTFDTLIFNDIATQALTAEQQAALYEWVLRGGHLVLGGGPGAQQTLDGLPATLRPVQVRGLEPVADSTLFNVTTADPGTLTLAQAEPVEGAHVLPMTGINPVGDLPLLVERPVGGGSVIFFAVALNTTALELAGDTQHFWSNLLLQRPTLPAGFGPTTTNIDMFTEGNIATSLIRLPALELPSLLTLSLLILAYIILVGPVTYFLLRKLDYQAMGWIVVPALTIVFALIAYSMGHAKRGGDLVLNEISLIEPLSNNQGEDVARVRSFVGVFSPERRSYTLETTRPVLFRPISIQGPWDTTQGNQGGIFVQGYQQAATTGARVANLEVPQWSMRAVMTDELRPFGGITAELTLSGDMLTGPIRNESDVTLYDVVLVQGDRVTRLGDVAPGEERQAALELDPNSLQTGVVQGRTPLSYLIYSEEMDRMSKHGGQPLPPEIQLRSGLLDTLYSYGPVTRSAQPMILAWVKQSLLDINVVDQRVARQQLSLITFKPNLQVAGQRITLGSGWLERQVEAPVESQCMGSQGTGFTLFGPQVLETLQLPRALVGLQPEQVTLIPIADGPWPAEVSIEVFDWTTGTWVTQTLGPQPLALEEPARFLSSHGEIQLRINGEISMMNAPGCMTIDAAITGLMP